MLKLEAIAARANKEKMSLLMPHASAGFAGAALIENLVHHNNFGRSRKAASILSLLNCLDSSQTMLTKSGF
jgi:hypothetical protein